MEGLKHDLKCAVDYCNFFNTDPSITSETPEVLEEIGGLKMNIVQAVMRHWASDTDEEARTVHIEMLAIELDGLTPAFIRAPAKAMNVPA